MSDNPDFTTEQGRAGLMRELGVDRYKRALQRYMDESLVVTINGHCIRKLSTLRHGEQYKVGDTGRCWSSLEKAIADAERTPSR